MLFYNYHSCNRNRCEYYQNVIPTHPPRAHVNPIIMVTLCNSPCFVIKHSWVTLIIVLLWLGNPAAALPWWQDFCPRLQQPLNTCSTHFVQPLSDHQRTILSSGHLISLLFSRNKMLLKGRAGSLQIVMLVCSSANAHFTNSLYLV